MDLIATMSDDDFADESAAVDVTDPPPADESVPSTENSNDQSMPPDIDNDADTVASTPDTILVTAESGINETLSAQIAALETRLSEIDELILKLDLNMSRILENLKAESLNNELTNGLNNDIGSINELINLII